MAEKSTIARPYAQAVFEQAAASRQLSQWSENLALASMVAQDSGMQGVIGNPRLSNTQLVDLFLGVCGDKFDDTAKNLVKLLVENGRLTVLPEIAALYEAYRAEAEKTVQAEVISAFPVTSAQQTNIRKALKKRLGREVELVCTTDNSLVGGAIIRAGDMVIDGSVTGQLDKLTHALTH